VATGRGLRGRTDGRAGTSNPAAERRDGVSPLIVGYDAITSSNHLIPNNGATCDANFCQNSLTPFHFLPPTCN